MMNLAEQEDALRPHFDAIFYMAQNPDLRRNGATPLRHFLTDGWRERRNPTRWFDVDFYLRMNLDVAEAGMNPFLHYVLAGRREGRQASRLLDAEQRQMRSARAPSARAGEWAAVADMSAAQDVDFLASRLGDGDSAGILLAFSHDDYFGNYGGVQKQIGVEQTRFTQAGWRFLHVSPAAPLPVLAGPAREGFRVAVRLDGARLGVFLAGQVAALLGALRRAGRRVEAVIHHVMGWSPEAVAMMVDAAGTRPIFWAHDFFTLCPSYALMRNDVAFCGAPRLGANACGICVYGGDRLAQAERTDAFFRRMRPFVLAPSASAYAMWRRGGLEHAGHAVLPLGRLVFDAGAGPRPATERVRVAHLGARVLFKGWSVYEPLAQAFAADPRYAFYQLGVDGHTPRIGAIRHIPVQVDTTTPDAMIDAVARHRIDIVVSWSLWPETFCFAAHEALAGGAGLITHGEAGNVPALAGLAGEGRALVLSDVADLHAAFAEGRVVALANSVERAYGAVITAVGSADWLGIERTDVPMGAG